MSPAPTSREPLSGGGARVVLTADRPQFFLGENVLVHYCLENNGDAPLTISVGGDYRGASRHLRFKVTATGEDGVAAADPDPSGFNLGGLGHSPEIKAGESWCQTLALLRYARIERPGTYTVTVTHDLGWEADAGAPPMGTLAVRFVMPQPAEAAQVVDAALALPKDPSWSSGKKGAPYPDLSVLRAPVYLPVLEARLATRKDRAVELLDAIGRIDSPDATRALIRIADGGDAAVALAAARALALRLPDPELAGKIGPRGPFQFGQDAERKVLIERSWRPEHAAPARAVGVKLVASADVPTAVVGAFILQCVGERADLPLLTSAMGRAIEATRVTAKEKDVYPRPRGACAELARTVTVFAMRGFFPTKEPRTAGELGVWLTALRVREDDRPAGWEGVLARAAAHPIPYVRELALEATPKPAPAGVLSKLRGLIGDADADVQVAACRAAERQGDRAFVPPLLDVLAKTREDWVLNVCQNAALALDARFEALRLAASRFDEPEMTGRMLGFLAGIVDDSNGRSSNSIMPAQAAVAKARWMAFLTDNEAALRRGERFKIGDPRVVPEMFPSTTLHKRDGSNWP